MTGSPRDIEALDLDGLKRLVLQLLEEVASLKLENGALREEIARLKALKDRPKLAPSCMEEAWARRGAGQGGKTGRRGGKLKRLVIDEWRRGVLPSGVYHYPLMSHKVPAFQGFLSIIVSDRFR